MCDECTAHRVGSLIAALRETLAGLDAEGEHVAAALVAEAIAALERNADAW